MVYDCFNLVGLGVFPFLEVFHTLYSVIYFFFSPLMLSMFSELQVIYFFQYNSETLPWNGMLGAFWFVFFLPLVSYYFTNPEKSWLLCRRVFKDGQVSTWSETKSKHFNHFKVKAGTWPNRKATMWSGMLINWLHQKPNPVHPERRGET